MLSVGGNGSAAMPYLLISPHHLGADAAVGEYL
jgi:hypothetical protein